MKYIKFALVLSFVVFSVACESWFPKTTYYYTVDSGCTVPGMVTFFLPNGAQPFQNFTNPLHSYVSKAYKFKSGEMLYIGVATTKTSNSCRNMTFTVTIMKGETAEGSIGAGGTVWKRATGAGTASVQGFAD